MLNRAILIGRLTKDLELRYTNNGTAVAKFTLAVDRRQVKDREKEVDFIDVIAAAPELYTALDRVRGFLDELRHHGIDGWSGEQTVLDALAKAEVREAG